MKLQLFILCCVLQSILGNVTDTNNGGNTIPNEKPMDSGHESSEKSYNPWKNTKPYWVPMEDGETSQGATLGGHLDGPLYVARSHVNSLGSYELLPGYLNQNEKLAYMTNSEGTYFSTPIYELLANCDQQWYVALGGAMPNSSFIGGKNAAGELLYVCRVTLYGRQIIGKYLREKYACYIPYDGHEREHTVYEFLTCKNGIY